MKSEKGALLAAPNVAASQNLKKSLDQKQMPNTILDGGEDEEEERDRKLRASQLKGPYASKNLNDPREAMRVKSLQLLCYKLATHKVPIQTALDKFTND